MDTYPSVWTDFNARNGMEPAGWIGTLVVVVVVVVTVVVVGSLSEDIRIPDLLLMHPSTGMG